MAGQNGSDVLLLVDIGSSVFVPVAGERNVVFTTETETIDVSSKSSGRFSEFIPGRSNSTVTLEAAHQIGDAGFLALKAAQIAGDLILIRKSESGIAIEEATGLITNITDTNPDQDARTASISIQVDGQFQAI